ncbi:MAG: hypothetical protein IK032_03240 [Bacteroidales bacterium]|nr:hypothetical protein [Bacteroidales bacterium]
MKKVITILALCLFGMAAYSQTDEGLSLTSEPQKFFSFEAFYGPSKYLYTGDDTINFPEDNNKFKQIGLVISNNNPLSKKINLYLNWGVGFVFSQYKYESEPFDFFGYKKTTTTEFLYFSTFLKANVGYLFKIPNTTVAFFPYVGIYGRVHIGGSCYYKFPNIDTEKHEIFEDQSKYSLFTESADNPEPWNRMEFGPNIGINAYFGSFMVGAAYGKTMNDLTKDTRVSEIRLSAGLRF